MSWKQSTLGDLIELENGYAFKSEEYTDEGHFLMRIANVQQGCISMQLPKFVSIPLHSNLIQFELNEGDMLMSLTGNVGRVGLIESHHLPAALNQRVAKIRIKDLSKIDKGYLFSFFNTNDTRARIENLANGAAQLNVSTKDIKSLTIPLPSLVEQKRIAAILDKAAEIKTKREQAIAKLDELAQSAFVEMFGSSIEIEGVELRSICDRVTDGTHQSPEWVDGGIPFIFISNIVNGEINLKTNKFISNNTYEELTRNCQINVGDILYTTVGSYGNVALVRDESKFAFQRHIAHIKPKQDIVNSRFMATMLGCTFVRRQVDKVARGVAQKTVNLGDLAKLKVICPPIKLQQEFAKRVELIEALKVKKIKASVSATQLISSLQHQAFTTGFNA